MEAALGTVYITSDPSILSVEDYKVLVDTAIHIYEEGDKEAAHLVEDYVLAKYVQALARRDIRSIAKARSVAEVIMQLLSTRRTRW